MLRLRNVRGAGLAMSGCLAVVLSGLTGVSAAEPDHAIVSGYERFASAEGRDAAAQGRLLLTELNCTACHAAEGSAATPLKPKQAPILDQIGSRAQVAWMRRFLMSPHGTKAGTTMPDVLTHLDEAERKSQVEALVHFLATTGSVTEASGDSAAMRRGEQLFHQIGCVACHDPRKEGVDPLTGSIPLGNVAKKYTLPSFMTFIRNPLQVRPAARMPDFKLNDQQARDLACFFFKDVKVPANLNYAYYEGDWQNIPDFGAMTPKTTGQSTGFDLEAAARMNSFGMRFTGFIHVPKEGSYTFHLGSDDGSRLSVDGDEVVNVDGVHPHQEKSARRTLAKGPHAIVVDYFQGGGEWTLKVEIEGSGLPRQPLESIATLTMELPKPTDGAEAFAVNPDLATQGRKLFASSGCASCHPLKVEDKTVEPEHRAKPLKALADLSGGCLADKPAASLPHYALTAPQKADIRAGIKSAGGELRLDEPQLIAETLTRFNCVACHQRGELGGVIEARSAFFETTQKEMGDEGRLPPRLDGVGDKLSEKWLKDTLDNGAEDRPYMLTSMPKFGGQNVGHLYDAFVKVDQKTEATIAATDMPVSHLKAAGRRLAGEKGLGCIKCHTFGPHQATGVQSIDLQKMTQRLRKDWFFRYMENPQVYRPGTRMPAPWPFGQATVKDVLDANVPLQMAAVWNWLEDGGKAGIPEGLVRNAIILDPVTEPIIYRNFIEGVSPRGIAVGYPEKVNLCFDAEQICLALVWHNGFIDASKHWEGRGPGNQIPLGDNITSLVRGVPFAVLAAAETSWPAATPSEQGYRFKGYRFNSRRQPSFLYEMGAVRISDEPVPSTFGNETGLVRKLTLTAGDGAPKSLAFRAAAGANIEEKDGWFVVDGVLKVRVSGAAIRQSGGRMELLVPVDLASGKAEVVQELRW